MMIMCNLNDNKVDELTTLLIASTWLTSSEARYEARRIIDAVRTEAYRRGYAEGMETADMGQLMTLLTGGPGVP